MRPHRLLMAAACVASACGAIANARAADPAADAQAYLQHALSVLQAEHINRAGADWPALRAEAQAIARGATAPTDTYPAIEHVIAALDEKHTRFYPAPMRRTQAPSGAATAPKTPFKMPEPTGELIDGRIGYLRIPSFGAPADHPDADLFVAMTRRILLNHDRAGVCGWIVDLRGNTGGNIWPMVDGLVPLLAPLLGDSPWWSFEVEGKVTEVTLAHGRLVGTGAPERPAFETRTAKHADAPIAVLVDRDTASSGEGVAGIFRGLARVRHFGETTADYVTVNNTVALPDGASMQLTVGYSVDRSGTRVTGPIQPDEPVVSAKAREAALRWLAPACGERDPT